MNNVILNEKRNDNLVVLLTGDNSDEKLMWAALEWLVKSKISQKH